MLPNKIKNLLTALALWCFACPVTAAEPAPDPLDRFLTDFTSLQAGFVQTLSNEFGERLEQTEGMLYLQQPGKFHWAYQKPYLQKIITDGDLLWIFDEDLEQFTIRELGLAIRQTPAAVILGNTNIAEHFIRLDMGRIEGFDWIKLTPRDAESQYENLRFGFDHNRLAMLIIHDKLGQIIRIDFKGVVRNADLSADLFQLQIPPGVDVIDERGIETD